MGFQKASLVSWIFPLYIILSTYSIGAGFAESLANYPAWHHMDAPAFSAYYHAFSSRFAIVFVPAFFLSLICVVLLIWFRPRNVPRWAVWMALLLKLTMLIATIAYLGPLSMQLGESYSRELLADMILADRIFRAFPGGVLVAVNFYMLKCTVVDD